MRSHGLCPSLERLNQPPRPAAPNPHCDIKRLIRQTARSFQVVLCSLDQRTLWLGGQMKSLKKTQETFSQLAMSISVEGDFLSK